MYAITTNSNVIQINVNTFPGTLLQAKAADRDISIILIATYCNTNVFNVIVDLYCLYFSKKCLHCFRVKLAS